MAQRFTETVNIQPQNLDTGSAQAILSVADRINSFSNQLGQVAAQKAVERGIASAADVQLERDEQGQTIAPEKKKEGFFGSVESKAHNRALQSAYLASINNDNRQQINELQAENPDNIMGFNDAASAYKDSVLQGVDPSVRQQVGADLDAKIVTARGSIYKNNIEKDRREANEARLANIESSANEAARLSREGDAEGSAIELTEGILTVQSLVESGDLTQTQANGMIRNMELKATTEGHMGRLLDTFDNKGIQASYDQLDDLSDSVPKGFTPDEWDGFVKEAQSELNGKLARQERLLKGKAEDIKKDIAFGDIERRIEGDDSIVMQPKYVDMYYQERVAPALDMLPLEQRQSVQAQYMDRTKVMPATIKGQIVNNANSMNPDLIKESALLVDRIDSIPGVVNDLPSHEQAYIQNAANLMQSMTGTEAMQVAMKATDPKDKPRIEAAEGAIRQAKKDEPDLYRDMSFKAFERSFFFSDPQITDTASAQMASEYGTVFENFVKAGMNEADAHTKASKMIQRNWGEDDSLGRKEVMKFPPNMYYSIDGDSEWVGEQLMADVTNPINGAVAGMNVSPGDVYLVANDETARTATTGKPSYMVNVMIDGMLHPAGQWHPDEQAEISKRKAENVKQALQRRSSSMQKNLQIDDETARALMATPLVGF